MADVTVKRVEDFEAIFGGGFRRVRAGLGVTSFGLALMDLPPDFTVYPDHDQAHDDQEEVYTALSGRATLRVGGQEGLYPRNWIHGLDVILRTVEAFWNTGDFGALDGVLVWAEP